MDELIRKVDSIAGIERRPGAATWLERTAFVFLAIMAIAAPHSIAATQTAWLLGMTAWAIRLLIAPRPRLRFGWMDAALLGLVAWSLISSLFSYDPATSLDKMRNVGLFLILYFAFYNLRTIRAARFIGIALIASCMVNVVWTPIERMIGRGVEIRALAPGGPFAKAKLMEGDTLLAVNGRDVRAPEDVVSEMEGAGTAEVKYHRPDVDLIVTLSTEDLLPGGTAAERLGLTEWGKDHKWRAKGFYGHFTTYSEVLQLIGSLLMGLLIAGYLRWNAGETAGVKRLRSPRVILPVLSFGLICLALLLSGTRASQLGLMASAIAMVIATGNRRLVIALIVAAVPAAAIGYATLQKTRYEDGSNQYRQIVWRDGLRLATAKPSHLAVGIGMDSIKKYWREWDLFDGGRLEIGHFHSTPVQLAVERGLPALALWFAFLGLYALRLWKYLRSSGGRRGFGIVLGCFGGLAGFVTAGMVHYNLGDGEVAMIFYLLAGMALRVTELPDAPEQPV